jgi:hypothetical protein
MKKILLCSISIFLIGCGINSHEGRDILIGSNPTGMTREEYMNTLDSAELRNGLICWTTDTAFATNADLLLLLDTLYQHVNPDSFPRDVRSEERWMADYRSKLGAFYDKYSLGSDTISIYAKADTVLNLGVRLMELGNLWSTSEMIAYNSTQFTFDRCREYGLLTQLLSCRKNVEGLDLVYKEWELYEKMLKKIGLIAGNMTSLNYWGGSIIGPLGTYSYLQILQARREMYQTVLDVVKDNSWNGTGVPLENAERFLFDCCSSALHQSDKKDNSKEFVETVKETETAIQELSPIIDEWVSLMEKVDYELTHDSSRHSIERAAAYMLMKWASVVTENLL